MTDHVDIGQDNSESGTRRRVALVSGANRGIGLAIATALAEAGLTVLLGTRQLENGERVCAPLRQSGRDIRPVQLDTTDSSSVEALCALVAGEWGLLDVLVNNAGISLDHAPGMSLAERMESTMQLNVVGTLRLIEGMLPLLEQGDHPCIVNISSELASFGLRADASWPYAEFALPAYQASKAALNALTLSLARTLGPAGIRVNAVCPGYTETDATRDAPVKPTRSPVEAARVAVRLALDMSPDTTGTFSNENGPLPW
ncbi:SDR family NAD(P)-dependent oxidoreductase [Swaminathania salitolerans]|uniref:Short-chain dehydrogenase n=1 Tax=Swaminathania salitolerans TaxID=182838 RepID=A0A511BPK2_9PROT|nr:SDR family NAD(P)-dependent oxidoreductase [Swaminathania salitolerans]GBQ15164.1 dehydrogenase [Swaminathania salitolerans LMG 21291]GEL02012.1 short-chain dehydrogenase [Swaminathania salitolerans]